MPLKAVTGRRELGTLTEMQKLELVRAHNEGLATRTPISLEVRRIRTDLATATAFLKRQPGYPGVISRKPHRIVKPQRARVMKLRPVDAEPVEATPRRTGSPSLPRVRFLDVKAGSVAPGFDDYCAGLLGQRAHDRAKRQARLAAIRDGRIAPDRDDAEEMLIARNAGLVVDAVPHRVSA